MSVLAGAALMPGSGSGVRIEDGPKRVRTYLGGELIADTRRPKLVWETPHFPAKYVPREDVRTELLTPAGHTDGSASRRTAHSLTVTGGPRKVEDATWHYPGVTCRRAARAEPLRLGRDGRPVRERAPRTG
jgi:uncharacterized protein (DUF427 family)